MRELTARFGGAKTMRHYGYSKLWRCPACTAASPAKQKKREDNYE